MRDSHCFLCSSPDPQGRESLWQFQGCGRWVMPLLLAPGFSVSPLATASPKTLCQRKLPPCLVMLWELFRGELKAELNLTQVGPRNWPAVYPHPETFWRSNSQMHTSTILSLLEADLHIDYEISVEKVISYDFYLTPMQLWNKTIISQGISDFSFLSISQLLPGLSCRGLSAHTLKSVITRAPESFHAFVILMPWSLPVISKHCFNCHYRINLNIIS